MADKRRLEVPSVGIARCLGSGSYEDGKFYWREGCDDCQRRVAWTKEDWIDPPPIIAFECEYRIGPDEIIAQGEHAPGPAPLSPAAEAIFFAADGMQPRQYRGRALAAALRALADQVVPENRFGPPENAAAAQREITRAAILVIATELELLPNG